MRFEPGPPVRLLRLYRVSSRLYFHLSVLFVLLLTRGQGLVAVEVELAVYGLAIVAAGPVATALGRFDSGRRTLVGGEILKATGLVLLASDPGAPAIAVAAQVINGFGFGLTSMTDPVVVAAALEGDTREMGRFQASAQSLMFLSTLLAGVAGAALFEWRATAPLWFSAGATLVSAAVAARLPSGSTPVVGVRGPGRRPRALTRRQLRVAGYYALTRGFMLAAFVGVLPFLLYREEHVGVLGLAFALGAFSAGAFATASTSQRLLQAVGEGPVLAASCGLLLGAFVCFSFTRDVTVTVLAMTVMGAGSGTVRPVTMRLLGEMSRSRPEGAGLGEVSRRMESAFGVVNAVVIAATGMLVVHTSFRSGMLVLASAFAGSLVICSLATAERPSTVASLSSRYAGSGPVRWGVASGEVASSGPGEAGTTASGRSASR